MKTGQEARVTPSLAGIHDAVMRHKEKEGRIDSTERSITLYGIS
jgi:hypothetical protein